MQNKLFSHTLKNHFVKTTVVKQFKMSESELLQAKTNNSAHINPKEPYQQFNYKEEDLHESDIEGR